MAPPNTTSFQPGDQIILLVEKAEKLESSDINGKSDPYCMVIEDDASDNCGIMRKTNTCMATLNPVWNSTFRFSICSEDVSTFKLLFEVFDWDRFTKDDFLGRVRFEIVPEEITPNVAYKHSLKLQGVKSGTISIEYKWDTTHRISGTTRSRTILSSVHDTNLSYCNLDLKIPFFEPTIPTSYVLHSDSIEVARNRDMLLSFIDPLSKNSLSITYLKTDAEHVNSAFDELNQDFLKTIQNGSGSKYALLSFNEDVRGEQTGNRYVKAIQTSCRAFVHGTQVFVTFIVCNYRNAVVLKFAIFSEQDNLDNRKVLYQVAMKSKISLN